MTEDVKNREMQFIQGLTEDLSSPVLIFPTSLKATMNIRHALMQEDLPNERLTRIISTEPVLSAHILRVGNSAAYNPEGKITTQLSKATVRLGYAKVRNLTIYVGLKQLTDHRKASTEISKYMDGIWKRSLRVSAWATVIAKQCTKVDPENAMLAALLHDVGKFYILNRAMHYQSLLMSQQELWEMVDAWRLNIGATILENWEISAEIRQAIQNMDNSSYENRFAPNLSDVLLAADLLDRHFDEKSPRKLNWDELPAVLKNLELNAEKSQELFEASKVELDLLLSSTD